MDDPRKIVFNEIRTLRFNVLYYKALVDRYRKWDNRIKIFVAIAASSAVAAWIGEMQIIQLKTIFVNAWKILSLIAAILSIISPFLKYDTKIKDASGFYSSYAIIWTELESVYLVTQDKKRLVEAWSKARESLKNLNAAEHSIEDDESLKEEIFQKVLKEYENKY